MDALFNIQCCPLRLIDRFGDRADKRNDGVLHGFLSVEKKLLLVRWLVILVRITYRKNIIT